MKLLLALGMEMGSWEEDGNITYNIMVNENRIILAEDQFNVWLLAQQVGFTPETAANYLKKNLSVVETAVKDLLDLKAIIYWNEDTLVNVSNYNLTPRGHASPVSEGGQQLLVSYIYAQPIAVESFGHYLWVYGNAFAPLHQTLLIVASKLNITIEEAYINSFYWIGFLVRHGLAILNPPMN